MSGSPDKVRGRIPIGKLQDVYRVVEASRRREIAEGAALGLSLTRSWRALVDRVDVDRD